MKKAIINLLIVLFLIPIATQARVWRVNNNAGVGADFPNLEEAMSNNLREAGDIIHLEPSANPYLVVQETFTANNELVTIIGNGYLHFLGDNLQQDINQSMIVSNTTEIFVNANIKFIGIVFNNSVILVKHAGPRYVNDVSFESCMFSSGVDYFDGGNGAPNQINGVHFLKNYILNDVRIVLTPDPGNLLYNFTFENNIILGSFKIDPTPLNHDVIIIRNNVFGSDYTCFDAFWANNIFKSANAFAPSGFDGSTLKNNIFARPIFTTNAGQEVNNLFGIDMSTVLVSNPAFLDRAYELNGGSIAIGAGIPNGTTPVDCGAYGGPDPYKPFGMPAIPSIGELNVPPSVLHGNNIRISVKSSSNN